MATIQEPERREITPDKELTHDVIRGRLATYGIIAVVLVAVVVAFFGGYVVGDDATSAPAGTDISDDVMRAWASGDQADIEAVYDSAVVMILDGEEVATDRDEIASVITQAINFGNTYEQVGPVALYEASDGDLYVAGVVEVVGLGHPNGVPVVGFYRVHDGKVIRHVFMDAEHY